jgi:hypothetical protein
MMSREINAFEIDANADISWNWNALDLFQGSPVSIYAFYLIHGCFTCWFFFFFVCLFQIATGVQLGCAEFGDVFVVALFSAGTIKLQVFDPTANSVRID